MNAPAAPPVVHRLSVPLDPAQAFDLFVHQIARWWPFAGHSCAGDDACDVRFEPRVGGAVTELTRSGLHHPWGTLTAWDPPAHFAMTWHPAQPQAHATQLWVRFVAEPGGCRIELVHDGWAARGEAAVPVRDGYHEGWLLVLGRYRRWAEENTR
ncbi:MAG: SRPBCC domain-containing protein [Rubrivivax sp.]